MNGDYEDEYIYIYIYIYCVCVCVCACFPTGIISGPQALQKRTHVIAFYCRLKLLANFLEFSLHKTKQTKLLKCSSCSESSLCHVLLL